MASGGRLGEQGTSRRAGDVLASRGRQSPDMVRRLTLEPIGGLTPTARQEAGVQGTSWRAGGILASRGR
jgi:hypothetical protein